YPSLKFPDVSDFKLCKFGNEIPRKARHFITSLDL
ncbi:MAG: hypothetical protein RLZZ139_2404, partial [Cyanobacteriota bacterium]